MRLVIDLSADDDGRPVGSVRIDAAIEADVFRDWLDLLRVLEMHIDALPEATRERWNVMGQSDRREQ